MVRECAAEGCPERAICKGYCGAHYRRWRYHGDPKAHIPIGSVTRIRLAEAPPPSCSVEGCAKTNNIRAGLCNMHYQRKLKHGDPGPAEQINGRCLPAVDRLAMYVEVMDNGCIEWTGCRNRKGYGHTTGKSAHRAVYEATVGPIPEGLQLDHLCMNPPCVNVDHLEPVTPRENSLRMWRAKRGQTV